MNKEFTTKLRLMRDGDEPTTTLGWLAEAVQAASDQGWSPSTEVWDVSDKDSALTRRFAGIMLQAKANLDDDVAEPNPLPVLTVVAEDKPSPRLGGTPNLWSHAEKNREVTKILEVIGANDELVYRNALLTIQWIHTDGKRGADYRVGLPSGAPTPRGKTENDALNGKFRVKVICRVGGEEHILVSGLYETEQQANLALGVIDQCITSSGPIGGPVPGVGSYIQRNNGFGWRQVVSDRMDQPAPSTTPSKHRFRVCISFGDGFCFYSPEVGSSLDAEGIQNSLDDREIGPHRIEVFSAERNEWKKWI